MVSRYVKALDLQAQRSAAGDIQRLLLDETPVIISYFPNLLVPVRKGIKGFRRSPRACCSTGFPGVDRAKTPPARPRAAFPILDRSVSTRASRAMSSS